MLLIRQEQLSALGEARWRDFEGRVLNEMRRCFPFQWVEIGNEIGAERIRRAIQQARSYEFELEYDILRFVYLTFGLAPEFWNRAEYPWAAQILDNPAYSGHTKADLLMQHGMAPLGIEPPADDSAADAESDVEEALEPDEPAEFDGLAVTEDDEAVPEFEEQHEPVLTTWNDMAIEDEPDNSADDIRE